MVKQLFNVKKLALEWGVKEEPFMEGEKFIAMEPKWDVENFRRLVELVDEATSCPAAPGEYLTTDSHEPWITLALLDRFSERGMRYLYPREGGDALELNGLPRGEREDNCGVRFEVFEQENGDIWLNMNSDEKDRKGGHTFDLADINGFVVPDLPDGRNIFIHGKGMFCAMINVAMSYIPGAKSLWLAAHDADYVCAHSKTAEFAVGDERRRSLANEL